MKIIYDILAIWRYKEIIEALIQFIKAVVECETKRGVFNSSQTLNTSVTKKIIDERGNSHSYGDLKPAHFHIYLKLFNYRKQDEVYRWFEKYKSHGNTFVEPVRSTTSVLKYLTHEDDASIGAGKHIYSREQIVSYNVDFDSVNYTNDSTSMILQDLLNGFSIETLVFKYGREFVYHIRDYDLICKIKFGLNI